MLDDLESDFVPLEWVNCVNDHSVRLPTLGSRWLDG